MKSHKKLIELMGLIGFGELPAVFCFNCSKHVPDAYDNSDGGRYKGFCDACISSGAAQKIAYVINGGREDE